MKIPISFKVGKRRYTVAMGGSSCTRYGFWYHEGTYIKIFCRHRGNERSPADMARTFWHEAVHVILKDMKVPLWKDESFVDEFAVRLNQLVHSAKFE